MPFEKAEPHDAWAAEQVKQAMDVDGHRMAVAYYENGERHDGPPVVLLHGIPTWSFLWTDVAPELVHDRHVVAPDLVGYGNSSMRDEFDRSIRAQEAMLVELLDHLDAEEVDLVGHDVGGGVALRYAAHEPDAVRKLVLSNSVCYDSWPVEFVSELGLPSVPGEESQADVDAKLEFAFREGLYGDRDDDAADELVAGLKSAWQGEQARVSLTRCAVATNTNHTTEIEYGEITADTLLLWGGDDVLQSVDYAERLAEDIAGETELVALDDAYHWVMADRPEAYVEELRSFLVE